MLRKLHAEEMALVSTLKRTRDSGSGDSPIARDHRRSLGQTRQRIQELLPRAVMFRDQILDEMDALRPQAEALRARFDGLRAQVKLGQLDAASANVAANTLQEEYRQALSRISQLENDLSTLH